MALNPPVNCPHYLEHPTCPLSLSASVHVLLIPIQGSSPESCSSLSHWNDSLISQHQQNCHREDRGSPQPRVCCAALSGSQGHLCWQQTEDWGPGGLSSPRHLPCFSAVTLVGAGTLCGPERAGVLATISSRDFPTFSLIKYLEELGQ